MPNVPVLLGAQCSRYSARVRSYLIKKGIAHVERVPTAWTFQVTIARRFGDPAVPVLITPEGEWIADSETILDALETRHPGDPIHPPDPVQAFFAALASVWASEFWLPVDLATRWLDRSEYPWWYEELGGAMLPGFPKALQNAMAAKVARLIQSHLPRVGATHETAPLIWRWASRMMDALDAHFAQHPYLLGDRATRFDFGLMCPLYGHIARDPWSRDEFLLPRPHLHAWVWRMSQPYLTREAPPFAAIGAPVPATLQPVVRSIFDEFVPYVEGTLAELGRATPPPRKGARIDRFLGPVSYPFAGQTHARPAVPFTLWLVQRALDLLESMPADDAERVRRWVRESGGARLLELAIPRLEVAGLTVRFAP
ncbi:MAG: glutathione S-transferase family protein [Burkholderiales bacterium]|nr:glutathione S-transferase family protein [Burkholderiales bacterium]